MNEPMDELTEIVKHYLQTSPLSFILTPDGEQCEIISAEKARILSGRAAALEAENERLQVEVTRLAGLAIAHAPPEQVSYYEYQTCGACGGSGNANAEITSLRCAQCLGKGKVLIPAIGPPIGLSATSDTKGSCWPHSTCDTTTGVLDTTGDILSEEVD